MAAPSPRILKFVDALSLEAGMRVLEIGCGPGVAAREIAARIGDGFVLAIDRSEKAIMAVRKGSKAELDAGQLALRRAAIEDFALQAGEERFDLAFAMRVGALDGRHPKIEQAALACVAKALKPGGKLFLDGGNPLREIDYGH